MKRLLSLLAAIFVLLSFVSMSACDGTKKPDDGKKDEDPTEQTGTPDDGKKDDDGKEPDTSGDVSDFIRNDPLVIPEDAKELYAGRTFTIAAPIPWGRDMFVREELNDDPLNDSIFNMNAAVMDTLGVKIAATQNEYTHEQAKVFIDSVLAGDHKFDVMPIHTASNCAALVIADAVLNFDYLENVDLSKPWWNKTFTEQTSILGYNYFAVSSSCYQIYFNTVAILFNKTLAKERGLPDLYELVRKNEWTIDKMLELTKNFSQDLNSDGIYDENDIIAVISDNGPHINAWLPAFRQSTVVRGENDEPTIVVNSARMATIIDKLDTLYNKGRRAIIYNLVEHQYDFANDYHNKAFAEGRVLFDITYLDLPTKLRDYEIDYGILPMPKLNAEQEDYGSFVEAWSLCYAVPKDCPDPDFTGTVLETMAYYSYHNTYPAILRQVIYGTGTRDVESSEMLDIIYKNMTWDFGYIYTGSHGYARICAELITIGSTDMASYIAERKNLAEKQFADLYDAAVNNAAK